MLSSSDLDYNYKLIHNFARLLIWIRLKHVSAIFFIIYQNKAPHLKGFCPSSRCSIFSIPFFPLFSMSGIALQDDWR